MAGVSLLSEEEIHGLVDDTISVDRRAEVLRRAASSPRDRALVEAWQDQNDLIRAAFAEVEREPLPRALDLHTPARLHAVARPASAPPPATAKPARWRHLALSTVTLAAVALGLFGSWYMSTLPADDVHDAAPRATEAERTLADRTVAALAFGEPDSPSAATAVERPALSAIPDLSASGFAFVGAEARSVMPKTVIFRYRSPSDERVALGATRVPEGDSDPVQRDNGFGWRHGHVAFAVYGTAAPERLRAIAVALRNAAAPD